MPKINYIDNKIHITPDENNPEDTLKLAVKSLKGKPIQNLTVADKANLFDYYVKAGVIKLQ